jgi:hypothetical protein
LALASSVSWAQDFLRACAASSVRHACIFFKFFPLLPPVCFWDIRSHSAAVLTNGSGTLTVTREALKFQAAKGSFTDTSVILLRDVQKVEACECCCVGHGDGGSGG